MTLARLLDLMDRGISPVQAVDYLALKEYGMDLEDYANQYRTDVKIQSVKASAERAEKKLAEKRRVLETVETVQRRTPSQPEGEGAQAAMKDLWDYQSGPEPAEEVAEK